VCAIADHISRTRRSPTPLRFHRKRLPRRGPPHTNRELSCRSAQQSNIGPASEPVVKCEPCISQPPRDHREERPNKCSGAHDCKNMQHVEASGEPIDAKCRKYHRCHASRVAVANDPMAARALLATQDERTKYQRCNRRNRVEQSEQPMDHFLWSFRNSP
jgi:hypothetical protein